MAGAVLVAVLAVHLLSVGNPIFADEIQCTERCVYRQGYCTPSGDCRCYPGYEGRNCDRCQRGPYCLHGTCDQPWQCNCKDGWGGLRCDKDLKVCERTQPCQNHATCINDGIGDYLCVCHRGFSGRNCDQYSAGGMSDTKPTSEPSTTTTKAPTTPPKQCQHDGRCQLYGSNGQCRKCICKPGYVGLHCEENVNECLMRPCANGGKCFDLSNNFFCECLTGFTSRYCENDVDECKLISDMCYNGGICTNNFGSFECACPEGYSGKRCERADRVAPKVSNVPLVPRIIRVTAYEDHVTETTTMTQQAKETQTTAQSKRKPKVIKNPESEVKMTRVTHELKISSVNGDYSASNNELLIRSDVDRDPGSDGSSAQAMQAMTFVFMGLAIVILVVILVLIYLRCFKNQSEHSSPKRSDSNAAPTVPISSVDKNIRPRSSSTYNAAVSLTVNESPADSLQDLDEASMQIQPCLTEEVRSYSHQREAILACPTPPPPYVLSAVDARRTSIPLTGYYVALPPVSSRDSCQNVSETSARKPLSTSHVMTSREETTSLLDADSPTLSHKIVV